jgi:hypothetical protein
VTIEKFTRPVIKQAHIVDSTFYCERKAYTFWLNRVPRCAEKASAAEPQ